MTAGCTNKKLYADSSGFTLIELIVFIIVGGIIIPAFMVAFTSTMRDYAQPEHYLKARYFAQQKLEELSGLSYAGIGVPDTTYDYITTDPSCDITKPETCYKWKWKVTYMKPDFSADSSGNYKRISVTIQTRSPYNIEYAVETIITKRPKEP
jgi:type II secretory pathway pseudopilin PulG